MLNPKGDSLQAIPINGQLIKALALDTPMLDAIYKGRNKPVTKVDLIKDLKENANYIVSTTGKEDGNTKVWIFTLLEFVKCMGYENAYLFEKDVCNVIIDFFEIARRPAKKDIGLNMLINFPEDISKDDAIRIYNDGTPFVYNVNEFVLDTDEKIDAGVSN